MEELLDVVICDPLEFDEMMFNCWLEGKKPEETVTIRIKHYRNMMIQSTSNNLNENDLKFDNQTIDLLKHEVIDHYRSYEILEHYICQPYLLSRQLMIQIPQNNILWIIEKYYILDDNVVREMLGKRFSKNRKDLDDISESTHLPLVKVTRQFDNLKRIYSSLEDTKQFQCNFYEFIENQFVLPVIYIRKYTCLLFLILGKFALTSKKRFNKIPILSLELCAAVTMATLLSDSTTFANNWKYVYLYLLHIMRIHLQYTFHIYIFLISNNYYCNCSCPHNIDTVEADTLITGNIA
jgi:hypothetical protein